MHNAGCFSGSNFFLLNLLKSKVNKTKPELFTCIKENDKTVKITHIEIDLNVIIIHSETSQIVTHLLSSIGYHSQRFVITKTSILYVFEIKLKS